jgi:hypothetical protein
MSDRRFSAFRYREDAWAVWDAASDSIAWFCGRELQRLSRAEAEAAECIFNQTLNPAEPASYSDAICLHCGKAYNPRSQAKMPLSFTR